MRITDAMLTSASLADIQRSQARAFDAQEQVSTGKRINHASDDADGAARAVRLRGELAGIARQGQNADAATSWLSATESSLGEVSSILQRVRELAVQAGNGTLSPSDRKAIADEVDQLTESVRDQANTTLDGRYLFSGAQTTTRPYGAGSDAYLGGRSGQDVVALDVGPGVSVQVNADGLALFGEGNGDGLLIGTLRTLSADIRSGNGAAVQGADLQALDRNATAVVDARAATGATQNRVDAAKSRLADLQTAATKLLSSTEDADMAQAIMTLSTQRSAYQAALQSGASVIQQRTLMDFLT
ncbi:MAG TPA: flagellar hook-associated protein FlgL [Solirubrobacteraceae bacterium]|nr:flagellar hook-associated protein FlgL [Solirubrobacteraceae bacterium]